MSGICKVEECNSKYYALDYCIKHYTRFRQHGNPLFTMNHGKSETDVYKTWRHMKARCLDSSHSSYKNYGGRGITICKSWLDFLNFYNDMGDRPEGMQIDRINNDGNYELGNCQWVTRSENNKNKRPTIKGKKLTIKQVKEIRSLYPTHEQKWIAEKYNLCKATVSNIINYKIWKNVS